MACITSHTVQIVDDFGGVFCKHYISSSASWHRCLGL